MAYFSQYPSFLEKFHQANERAAWALNPLIARDRATAVSRA